MTLIDISRTLVAGTAVWPGDTPFHIKQTLARSDGASVNLTTLTLSAHTGSHVDAPYHFSDDGLTVEKLELRPYWGPAQVVSTDKEQGPLEPQDLRGYDLSLARRLLIRSGAARQDPERFPQTFIYPSPTLAAHLASRDILLLGSEAPSMDAAHSKRLPGHNALHKHRIAILEWLDLSQVDDGLYKLVALPLKIAGGDGSPVRAALRTLA